MIDADSVSRLRGKLPNIPPHPIMAQAYLDCMHWAIGFEPIISAFRSASGMAWTPGSTPIDRMIDEATGAHTRFMEAFIPWFDENVWGEIEEPVASRDGDRGEGA